ncbi:cyclin-like protein [Sanghuangporus baumii]|uniref:Cyclin-like protein n=1 Tax=Sanghuangporus baumii TaxID=108892 RepID=A0A9Q5MXX5_SANBA|nr:cyclin-like protein [Sanghuangporus baumii]
MVTVNMGVEQMRAETSSSSQWRFPSSALLVTPSAATSGISLDKELYDRARGIEFLYRLGASLQLPSTALVTAATWFHRFYMRYSMEDYHRQDVAAGCIFLATKTEECGRKLRDVAKVFHSKVYGTHIDKVTDEEIQVCQDAILVAEAGLLEALCFDFVVASPHEILVDLLERYAPDDEPLCDASWCIAYDSYRTVLCLLYDIRIIAAASFILADRFLDGDHSPSLDARIASSAPSASLPTPPTNKPTSPDASRVIVEHYQFNETELAELAEALTMLIEFYAAQNAAAPAPHLQEIGSIQPPATPESRLRLYRPDAFAACAGVTVKPETHSGVNPSKRTPDSSQGGKPPSKPGWRPVIGEAVDKPDKLPRPRLNLE